jgi:hypothetical protein
MLLSSALHLFFRRTLVFLPIVPFSAFSYNRGRSCLTMLSYRLSIVLVSLSLHFSPVLATCYMPNGTAVDNVAFQPCNQVTDTISMCCGTNWTTGGVSPTSACPMASV